MEKKVIWLIAAVLFVQLAGAWCIDVMDVDSAQYASISLEMLKSKSFLQVHDFGKDYLDKPPLLFWISSLSFSLFGISQFTFRILPILLSLLVGAFATFRFCKLYYTERTGYLAALFYLSSQTVFLMAFDLRTDSLLTAAVMLAIAEFAWFTEQKKWNDLIIGSIALGFAMLAKGPVGLIVVVFALGSQLLMKKNWSMIFNWRWLVGLVLVSVLLLPMSIGLYQQFDLHPEKLVNGHTGVSGLRFYFWGQSFGRITGESPWKNDTDKFFLLHSYLWCSLPWCLLTLVAVYYKFRRFTASREYMSLGGLVLTIAALSFSAYKLPHYINVLIPLGSILAAWFMTEVYEKSPAGLRLGIRIIQGILLSGLWVITGLLAWFVFPVRSADALLLLLIPALVLSVWYWFSKKNSGVSSLVLPSAITIIAVNLFMNTFFYPNLLQYQAPSVMAKFIRLHNIPVSRFFVYEDLPTGSMDFYAGQIVQTITWNEIRLHQKQPVWIYIPKNKLDTLALAGHSYEIIKEVPAWPVTRLNMKFLNPRTRDAAVTLIDLVKIN